MKNNTRPFRLAQRRTDGSGQQGLSLVEVLVGMVITLVLIGGMMTLFLSTKQTYRYNDHIARLQENARFAMDFMQRSFRMAGHIGCGYLGDARTTGGIEPYSIVPGLTLEPKTAFQAYTYSTSQPGVVASYGHTGVPGTDVITVVSGEGASVTLSTPVDRTDNNLVITNNGIGFKEDEIALIADCIEADLFRITNTPGTGNNITIEHTTSGGRNSADTLGSTYAYDLDARVMRLRQQVFYLAQSQRLNRQGNTFRSMYVNGIEMIEGVDNMAISYGLPATLPAGPSQRREVGRFVPRATVDAEDAWDSVIAARIELLLATPDDNAITTNQTYTFDGNTITATDHRMYSVVTTTVALRSRY